MSENKQKNEQTDIIEQQTCYCMTRRYFEYAHFIPIVGVGKRGAYINWSMVTCQSRQYLFGTALWFTGPRPADPRQ